MVLQILSLSNINFQVSNNICIHNTQSMHFPLVWCYTNDSIPTKHLHWENVCNIMRASRASELRTFSHFHILKLLFPSIFCWYFRYFVSETFNFRCQNSPYILQSMQFPFITHGMVLHVYTDKTVTLRKCMCMRASLENFGIFTFLKLLLLSIFCRYIRYFVGTNDMLVGLHVPTNFLMYWQKTGKALWGGGGGRGGNCPPAPPHPPPLWLR